MTCGAPREYPASSARIMCVYARPHRLNSKDYMQKYMRSVLRGRGENTRVACIRRGRGVRTHPGVSCKREPIQVAWTHTAGGLSPS